MRGALFILFCFHESILGFFFQSAFFFTVYFVFHKCLLFVVSPFCLSLQQFVFSEHFWFSCEFVFMRVLVFHSSLLFNILFCLFSVMIITNPPQDTAPQRMCAAMSFSYIGAMICRFQALQYIAYPTQVKLIYLLNKLST